MRAVIFFQFLFLLSLLPGISGQSATPLALGQRVRVTVPGIYSSRIVGTITELDDDSIVVANDGFTWRLGLNAVSKLEVSDGMRRFDSRKGLRAAGLGFVGGAAYVVIGMMSEEETIEAPVVLAVGGFSALLSGAVAGGGRKAAYGGLLGAALGSAVGYAATPPCSQEPAIFNFSPGFCQAMGAMAGGVVGGTAGFVIAALIPVEQWVSVEAGNVELGLTPRRGGLALRLTARY